MRLLKQSLWLFVLGFAPLSHVYAQVGVTATGGTPVANYTDVNSAFAAINAGSHTGTIIIAIQGNTTEPATPTPLLASGTGSASYVGITIRPQGGNFEIHAAAAPSANRGIIELTGADNVTIDGDDPTVPGTQNLRIVAAASTTDGIACIRLSSNSFTGADGANNNTVKNCIITGSRNSATATNASYGIQFSNGTSTSSASVGAYSSLNTLIQNNTITRCFYGIHAIGNSSTYLNTGTQIIDNTIGSAVADSAVAYRGIDISYSSSSAGSGSALISENDLRSGYGTATSNISTIEIGTNNAGINVTRNYIHDSANPSSGVWGMYGIHITSAVNNVSINISNNIIRNIAGYGSIASLGNQYGGVGIFIREAATDIRINNNTIALLGGTEMVGTCVQVWTAGASISQFQNNLLVNNVPSVNACVFYTSGTGNISGGTVDNNNYYVNSVGVIGYYNGANRTGFADWKTATGKDVNSFNVLPAFVSSTDLHIQPTQSFLESGGAPVASTGVNVDFDNDARPGPTGSVNGGGTAPDIGADEFDGIPPGAPPVIDSLMLVDAGGQCTATSHDVSAAVTPGDAAISGVVLNYSFNGSAQPPITMTGGNVNAASVWSATIPAPTPGNANVTWSVTVTDALYSRNSAGTAYNDLEYNASASASDTAVCPGGSSTLSATVLSPVTQVLGSGTTTSTSAATNPFYGGYGGVKTQYIIRGSELSAAGFSAGNINSIGIKITSPGSTLNGFALHGGLTSLNALTTTIVDVPTSLYSAASFVPTSGVNTFNFSSPIAWDGTSNIILSFCWSNNNASNTPSVIEFSTVSFVSSNARYVDNKTAAQVCGYTGSAIPTGWNGSSTVVSNRPNFIINGATIIPITAISWKDGAMVEVGTTNPLTVSPTQATTYTAEITAQGCALTPTVAVNTLATHNAPGTTGSQHCGNLAPTASVASNSGSATPTFGWYDSNTASTALQTGASTTYLSPVSQTTTFYVSELMDDAGCESSRTPVTVTVLTPDSIKSMASEMSICLGETITLSAENANPTPTQNYTYAWSGTAGSGVGASQPGSSITATPTQAGTYTFEVSAVDGTCDTTSTVDLVVNANPTATVTENGGVFESAPAASYMWMNCATNALLAGETGQSFTPEENGMYAVIVTNTQGCADTSACVNVNNVGIDDLYSQSLSVYPNPTNGEISIRFTGSMATVEVINAQGVLLFTRKISSGDIISLGEYKSGIYFIRLSSENGTAIKHVIKN